MKKHSISMQVHVHPLLGDAAPNDNVSLQSLAKPGSNMNLVQYAGGG